MAPSVHLSGGIIYGSGAIEQGRDARLDEVTRQLRYGLEVSARERALQTAMAALRSEYEVRQ